MQRRTFLKTAAATVQSAMWFVVAVPGIRFLLDPLWRRRKRSAFIRVAPLRAVAKGRPVRVVVSADRWDAYTHHPPGPIGSVFLFREASENGGAGIRCLQTICPHLGCGIDYAPDRGTFSCPCHASGFDRTGKRLFGPSPRDMDELDCRVTDPDEGALRWIEVKYQEFQTGVTGKQPVA